MDRSWLYITTNYHRTVLYIGVTNDLKRRLIEHYEGRHDMTTFTGKYKAYHLLYSEEFTSIVAAIEREKQLKRWTRAKKDALIATLNPKFEFLEHLI